ncbi:hypothetical protein QBC37DRAFT_412721 [Rhypophila decipiens]|uniref:Uncharacterized protein n=1 Tax=Rhypophila decipiens TaxID=261697 RepID=A0AAN7BBU3_9PEZI|nr:hypothetical protein QBC37DRAFT_412721 [Rhypophila decipiens]
MRPMTCCAHCGGKVGERQWRSSTRTLWGWLSETTEIGLGTICGGVTWRFMVESESAQVQECGNVNEQDTAAACSHVDIGLLSPSPSLMLLSCLLFGCCVSSFVHRRQDKDPLQFLVYVVLLGIVVIVGHETKASANMILLGYLPWAMCLAMAISIAGHSLYREWKRSAETGPGEMEKGALLR